jgi:hypothetical protein
MKSLLILKQPKRSGSIGEGVYLLLLMERELTFRTKDKSNGIAIFFLVFEREW